MVRPRCSQARKGQSWTPGPQRTWVAWTSCRCARCAPLEVHLRTCLSPTPNRRCRPIRLSWRQCRRGWRPATPWRPLPRRGAGLTPTTSSGGRWWMPCCRAAQRQQRSTDRPGAMLQGARRSCAFLSQPAGLPLAFFSRLQQPESPAALLCLRRTQILNLGAGALGSLQAECCGNCGCLLRPVAILYPLTQDRVEIGVRYVVCARKQRILQASHASQRGRLLAQPLDLRSGHWAAQRGLMRCCLVALALCFSFLLSQLYSGQRSIAPGYGPTLARSRRALSSCRLWSPCLCLASRIA